MDILDELINLERLKNVSLVGTVISKADIRGLVRESVEIDSSCNFVNVKIYYLQDQYKKRYVVDGVILVAVDSSVEIGNTYAFRGTLTAATKEYTRDITLFKFAKEGATWHLRPVDVFDLSGTRFLKDDALKYIDDMIKEPLLKASKSMFDTNKANLPMVRSFTDLVEYGSLEERFNNSKVIGNKLTSLQANLLSSLLGQKVLQVVVEGSPLLTVEDLAGYYKESLDSVICYNFVGKRVLFERVLAKLESTNILEEKDNVIVFTDNDSLDRRYPYVKIKKGGLV